MFFDPYGHMPQNIIIQFAGTVEIFQDVLNSLQETTEVDHLMYDFLMRFVVEEGR